MEYNKPILIQDLGMMFPTNKSKQKSRYSIFKCFCGNKFKAKNAQVKSGHTKSCGCYQKYFPSKKTHGLSNHPLFRKLHRMKERCYDKNACDYKYYGGKGVVICQEWLDDFISFYDWSINNGWVKGLTIDRINPNGNYEPSNCRYVPMTVQYNNKRRIMSTNTSGYRGVYYNEKRKMWNVYVKYKQNNKFVGTFKCRLEAAYARDLYIDNNNLDLIKNFT